VQALVAVGSDASITNAAGNDAVYEAENSGRDRTQDSGTVNVEELCGPGKRS
jgi:hypothetical protein